MRPSKKHIQEILSQAEDKHGLRKNVLIEIYDAESQVVFMGRRRGISDKLRRIIENAALEVDLGEDE